MIRNRGNDPNVEAVYDDDDGGDDPSREID